jgi:uncharacterized oxidoreductase
LGNRVIIAGRRQQQLQETIAANPVMLSLSLDQGNAADVRRFASVVLQQYPGINVLINNAGILRAEDLMSGEVADAEATVAMNLLGPIRLIAALLPSLARNPRPAIVNVSSALAFMPGATIPTYRATKAALHSYTQSLRFQLRNSPVEVIEIIPPWVQTDLQGKWGNHPQAMPLTEYIAETMHICRTTLPPRRFSWSARN